MEKKRIVPDEHVQAMSREEKGSKRRSHTTREKPVKNHPRSLWYAQVPLVGLHSPQRFVREYDQKFDSSCPRDNKKKRTKVYHSLPMSYGELLQYWSKIMGFSSFLQGLEDLHIQKDTMSMPYVNTMEELEDIPWRIARPSKTRFNPWSMQIRSNSKNLSVVIRSIKIKDQRGAVFVCLLIMNVFIREYAFWEM